MYYTVEPPSIREGCELCMERLYHTQITGGSWACCLVTSLMLMGSVSHFQSPQPSLCLGCSRVTRVIFFYTKHIIEADGDSGWLGFWIEISSVV